MSGSWWWCGLRLLVLAPGPGRRAVIDGTVNSAVYQEILKQNVQL